MYLSKIFVLEKWFLSLINNRNVHQLKNRLSKLKLVCSGVQVMVTGICIHIPINKKEFKELKIFSKHVIELFNFFGTIIFNLFLLGNISLICYYTLLYDKNK